jgi:hypothetical protein
MFFYGHNLFLKLLIVCRIVRYVISVQNMYDYALFLLVLVVRKVVLNVYKCTYTDVLMIVLYVYRCTLYGSVVSCL